MKYQILISDYDDTLINDNGNLPEKNRLAIEKFIAEGGIFAINTGRMTNSILPTARKLGLRGYLGAYQGGVILDIESGNILCDVRLSREDTVKQLEELETVPDRHIHLYDGEHLYVRTRDKVLEDYECLSGIKATFVSGKLSEYAHEHNLSANKLMYIAENAELVRERERLMQRYNHLVYVLSKPVFLEILSKDGTKGAFVRYLAKTMNVPISKIIAVGDSLNDTAMVETAGLGLAVRNSHPELIQKADAVLQSTNNDGAIAEIIEKYIF